MQLKFQKTYWVISSIVLFISVILWIPPFFFIHDQTLLNKLSSGLEQSLAGNGLKIDIRQVHWERWNRLVASEVRLSDANGQTVPFAFGKLVIKVNLLSLLKHRHQPEIALREVELVNPRFELERYQNGTWNWRRYFTGSGRKMHFQTILRIADATILFHDARYGTYTLRQVNGTVDLKNFPVARWDLQGKLDEHNRFSWAMQGEMNSDQVIGKGTIHFNRAPLEQIRPFWPTRFPCRIHSGLSSGRVQLVWTKKGVWVEDGEASVKNAILNVSGFTNRVMVKKLKANFSPKQVAIYQSEILYRQAVVNFSGVVASKNAAILGDLKARSVNVADLAEVVPFIKEHHLSGRVNMKLHVGGTVGRPVLGGKVDVREGRITIAGRNIQNIAGKFKLSDNNLLVKQLTGNYRHASLAFTGRMHNILQPQYHLQIYGSRLDLTEFHSWLTKSGITTDATTDFRGEITGNYRRPVLSGNIALRHLTYQDYHLDNPTVKFAWSIQNGKFRILECTGDVNNGHLEMKGNISATPEIAAWDLTGRLSRVNLAAITYLRNRDFDGIISTDAVIRGNWKKGEKFNIGSIYGVVKGESLAFKGLSVNTAQAVYTWQGGRFRLDSIQGNVGQGRIFGSLVWDGSNLLTNMSIEDVRLQSLLNNPEQYPVDGIVKGDIAFEGPVGNLKGTMIGGCQRVRWLSHDVGDINGEIVYANNRFNITTLDVSGSTGDFAVRGSFGSEQNSALDLSLKGNEINLQELAGWLPIGNTLTLNGEGSIDMTVNGSFAAPKYKGTIDLFKPRFKKFTLNSGHAEFEGDLKTVKINEMRLSNDQSFIRLHGVASREKLNLEYSSHLDEIEEFDLNYKGNIVRGAIDLSGRIDGNPEKPEVTARVNGERIGFANFNNQYLTAQLTLKYPAIQIKFLRLSGKDGALDAVGNVSLIRPYLLDLTMGVTNMSAETLLSTLKINHVTAGGKLSGTAEFKGTLTDPVMKAEGIFTNGFINQLEVNGQFGIEYSHNNLQIQKVELRHGNGILVANGVWENGNTLKLTANLSNFPLQTLDLLVPIKSEASGIINTELRLEWSKSGVSGEYWSEISNLAVHQNQLGNLAVRGSYSETGVIISNGKLASSGGEIQFNGYVPWPVKLVQSLNLPVRHNLPRDIELNMVAREAPVEFFNFIPNTFTLAKGRMNGNLQLNGTLENPIISGALECNNTQLNLPTLPVVAENLQLILSINKNKVTLQKATGNILKKGKFSITGQVWLDKLLPTTYSLAVSGSEVYYKNSFFDGYGNLKVDLTGSFKKTRIAGEISVNNCRIGISGGEHRDRKQTSVTELDLIIKAGKNVRYRQIGIADVVVTGEIEAKGTIDQPKLSGKVDSEKGVLTLYGQNFIVQRGLAVFRLEQGYLPYLEVESNYKTPKAEILLSVKGQVGVDLVIDLSSQPHLSQEEIYTLLNWSLLNGEQPLTVDGMIGSNLSFVTDSLLGDVFNGVRNTLHLDYLYLDTNYTENEFRINMGDYVTDNLFVSYSRSLISGDPKESWGFDYHLTPELMIGGTYSIEDQMLWKLTYGFRFK